jgi:predicted MFS family arabinose efflux permease
LAQVHDFLRDLSLLRDRRFALLLTARTISVLGSAFAPVALAFGILGLPGATASTLSIVLTAESLPMIAFMLVGGVIADRLPRQRVMMAGEFLMATGFFALAVMMLIGWTPLVALSAAAALSGVATAVTFPALTGIIPEIVPLDRLQTGNALLGLGANASRVLGAVLGGGTVVLFGGGWALMASGALFAAAGVLIALLRQKPGERPRGESRSVLADLRDGWREFSSRQWIWVVVAQFAVLNACANGGINVLGPFVAAERLGGAPAWSAIMATQSAGFLVGGIVAMRVRPRRPILVAVLLTLGFAPPFFLLALGAPTWLVATSTLVSGVCGTTFSVLWATTLQTRVPDEMLSRISSYDALGSYLLGPLGLAIVGPVANAMGVIPTLVMLGTLSLLATALALLSPEVRTLTSERSVRPEHAAATRG